MIPFDMKRLRIDHSMTLNDLAENIDYSVQSVHSAEKKTRITIRMKKALETRFGNISKYLLFDSNINNNINNYSNVG